MPSPALPTNPTESAHRVRRALLVANPISGAGRNKIAAPKLAEELGRLGVAADVQFTKERGHAPKLADEAVAAGFDAVVGIGGDGTLREVAEGLRGRLPLGIFPTGTANVVARELAIPFHARGAAAVLAAGRVARIDTCRANGRLVLFTVGAGLDGAIVHALEGAGRTKAISYASYLRPVWRTLRSYRAPRLRIATDDAAPRAASFALVAATRYYAGPWVRFRPGPSLVDGRVEVYCFDTPTLPSLLAAGLRGILRALPGGRVARASATRVRIESDEPVLVQADGDPFGTTPVDLEVQPRSLPVIVPAGTAFL